MLGMMEATYEVRITGQGCDQDLVEQAREGSRAAFDALFTRHRHFVYSVCYRILGTREDAVDATQSAFIRAYTALRTFRGDAAFRSWLYRIAINECRAALRRKRRASRSAGLCFSCPSSSGRLWCSSTIRDSQVVSLLSLWAVPKGPRGFGCTGPGPPSNGCMWR